MTQQGLPIKTKWLDIMDEGKRDRTLFTSESFMDAVEKEEVIEDFILSESVEREIAAEMLVHTKLGEKWRELILEYEMNLILAADDREQIESLLVFARMN